MTEKYELRLCNDGNYYLYHKGVLINAPYISFDKFNKEDAESIIGELNHLSNENEQLKQKHRKLQIDFNEACGIVHDLREGKLDLEDENEQLKNETTRLEILNEKLENKEHTNLIKELKKRTEENMQLKKELDNVDEQVQKIHKLKEENEQLKKENTDLRVELDTHKNPLWSTRVAEEKIKKLEAEVKIWKRKYHEIVDKTGVTV